MTPEDLTLTMSSTLDVLVVGAGPAGLTLACDLRRRGVECRVISAAPGGFEGSRAKGLQPRTLEVLDDLGVLPALAPQAAPYPPLGLHLGPLTIPVAMYRRRRPAPDVPHPDTLLVPQYSTDAALRGRLGELGGRVEFATTLGAALRTVSIPRPPARLRRTYGIRGPAQILVRPDGYVAAVAHGGWRDALAESAARMAPPGP
ncbi:FAD-dependent monooxygenase [Dactylosporangium sp. NPDC000244]|uniref:FAD-dependent monooxygenase n=1 Tax=Dactylosporangium sp. NPDC000244 TaxID=3154365 RepID=UPI003327ADC9